MLVVSTSTNKEANHAYVDLRHILNQTQTENPNSNVQLNLIGQKVNFVKDNAKGKTNKIVQY